jgi:excisionase family DNA binding protein
MPKPALPPAELDTIPQFASRTNTSVRNIYRAIEDGRITVVYVGNTARIDPVANMARIRKARPSSAPRRGRPKKDAAS